MGLVTPILNLPQFLSYHEVISMYMILLPFASILSLWIEDTICGGGDLEGCSEQGKGRSESEEILIWSVGISLNRDFEF